MHWTYEPAMEQGVFPHEGGYTNDPRDPGGPTNWGITIYDARKYWKSNASAADVKAMPKSVAEAIYWPHYAVPLCYDTSPLAPITRRSITASIPASAAPPRSCSAWSA